MDDATVIQILKELLDDKDDVYHTFKEYKEWLSYIQKKAERFKQLLDDHYSDGELSVVDIIKRAKKYQDKLNINDIEFNIFVNYITNQNCCISAQ